jgi:hypothetical protein
MGKTFVRYSFITIGVYLFATYATGMGKVMDSGFRGTSGLVRSFQGR